MDGKIWLSSFVCDLVLFTFHKLMSNTILFIHCSQVFVFNTVFKLSRMEILENCCLFSVCFLLRNQESKVCANAAVCIACLDVI